MSDDDRARTFRPVIRENRILAGGMTIAEVRDGQLVFEDRYLRRCAARGSPDVPVDVMELLEALLEHYRNGGRF